MPGLPVATIHDDTLITRWSSLTAASLQNETVMLDIGSGRYYGLDDVGSDIWRRLETPRKFGELVDGLMADYEAERTVIAEDVRKLLSIMAEHKVIILT